MAKNSKSFHKGVCFSSYQGYLMLEVTIWYGKYNGQVNLHGKVYSMIFSLTGDVNIIFLNKCGFSKKGLKQFHIKDTDTSWPVLLSDYSTDP